MNPEISEAVNQKITIVTIHEQDGDYEIIIPLTVKEMCQST